MKKTLLFTLLSILLFSLSASAQIETDRYTSSRLDSLADQLKRDTVDLTDRTSEELRRGNSRNRNDLQTAFLAAQLDASVGLFQQMLRDRNNRASDLRDAAAILTDLARRAPSYGSNNNLWRSAQNSINDINRELGSNNSGGGFGGGNNNGGGQTAGRAYWRGIVDKQVQLVIRNRNIQTRTIGGRAYPAGRFSFTTALPKQDVSIDVDKKSGRGDVRVIQQPSRRNGYTAIVQIDDNDGGAKEYQLEINWR